MASDKEGEERKVKRKKPRIPPLPREEFTDDAREVFAFWGEPNAWEEGSKTNVINTMGNHPALGKVYNVWGMHFLMHNSMHIRQLELVVLRVAWRVKSEYEWHNHVGYAMNAGITLEEIEAIKLKPADGPWDELDKAVLVSVDELIGKGRISDKTWKILTKHYDKRQMMDLLFTIGHYVMTSWALSSMGVEMESPDPIGFDLRTASGRIPGKTYKPGEVEDWIKTRGY